MNRNVIFILVNAAFAGAVGGYAATRWGAMGALAGIVIAVMAGHYLRKSRR